MNKILIIPNKIKNKIIEKYRSNNKLQDIKFMTMNEFINNYYFSYDYKTIKYLMDKYNYSYEVALTYVKNLYYIKEYNYKEEKLKKLYNLKKELIENNLLIFNEGFRVYIKDKDIEVKYFDSLNKLEQETFNKLENIKITLNESKNNKVENIYKFNTLEDEVNYVCISIIELINKGIDINNIKILNINNDYINTIKRLFEFYNIPINLNDKTRLIDTYIGLFFINNLKNAKEIIFENIKNNFNLTNNKNQDIYNKLINITNKYACIDNLDEIKEILIYDLKHTYTENIKLERAIELEDLKNNIYDDNNYYFLINYNQESIPVIHKDEEYITDNLKEDTYLYTTKEMNKEEKRSTLNVISRIKNLIVTYKTSNKGIEYNISNLLENEDIKIIDNYYDDFGMSNIYNKIRLSVRLDDMIKYNIKDESLSLLYNNYKNINYMTYNNKYKKIDKEKLSKYLNNELRLSYSSLDNYNKCNFKYYLSNILKINIFEETFMTFIGKLYHYILSIAFTNEIDIDYEYEKYIKESELEFNAKEKFFLNKLKEELKYIIKEIKQSLKDTELDKALYEEEVVIEKNIDDFKIKFKGIIDKILYKEEYGKNYVAVIDYKTGNPNINLNNVIYGVDMQLPIYIYLIKNMDKLNNAEIVGFYLQKILNNEIIKDHKNTYEDLKKKNLLLQGYSNENIEVLEKFDKTYMNSTLIKSMKTTQKGFSTYSKVLSDEKIDKLINIIDEIIDKNIKEIINAEFDINPKKIGKKNYGCEFCKYNDICFKTNNDIDNKKEYTNLEFLQEGSEYDA